MFQDCSLSLQWKANSSNRQQRLTSIKVSRLSYLFSELRPQSKGPHAAMAPWKQNSKPAAPQVWTASELSTCNYVLSTSLPIHLRLLMFRNLPFVMSDCALLASQLSSQWKIWPPSTRNLTSILPYTLKLSTHHNDNLCDYLKGLGDPIALRGQIFWSYGLLDIDQDQRCHELQIITINAQPLIEWAFIMFYQ
jgi:hypothetical protein